MNQYFYETRGKEKIKELMREGQANQAIQRSSAPKRDFLPGAPKLAGISKLALNLLAFVGFLGLRGR